MFLLEQNNGKRGVWGLRIWDLHIADLGSSHCGLNLIGFLIDDGWETDSGFRFEIMSIGEMQVY